MPRSSAPPSSAELASADAGSARTTNSVPGGTEARRERTCSRSRRRTRLRVTAGPTLRLTTKPALAGPGSPVRSAWMTSGGQLNRRPSRPIRACSSRELTRERTGSIGAGNRTPATSASGGQFATALAAAVGDDGTAGTGTHPQPEPVGAGPPTVVRLEGALAHVTTPDKRRSGTRQAYAVRAQVTPTMPRFDACIEMRAGLTREPPRKPDECVPVPKRGAAS